MSNMNEKSAIEIAHRMVELEQLEEAKRAYALALHQEELSPEEEMEAASFLFFAETEDYKPVYRTFVSLFNRGLYQGEVLDLLAQAFYYPNLKDLQKRYAANCKKLAKYPYLFRKDFPNFEDLPILFFPFDDQGYLPFYPEENRFGEYIDFNDPIIDRYFFKDLEKPILTKDVFSQYQLEYLNDTVRKSEWVAKENHIYLHYTSWSIFCAYLQCLKLKDLLKDEKFVFLIEDEVTQYPIDFKECFGIDYSQYPLKPVGVREVNRLIWHAQLSAHNGGDFFNEIFAEHPNLLALDSIMMDDVSELVSKHKELWDKGGRDVKALKRLSDAKIAHPTEKDILVAFYLNHEQTKRSLDPASRIAPVMFFQPHFGYIRYKMDGVEGALDFIMSSKEYEKICKSPLFTGFKYIKTFTPMRRFTTSYGGSLRFLNARRAKAPETVMDDLLSTRILSQNFWVDPRDRLQKDSVIVRFEDGKLNPKATFTALTEFLDIPYTESLKECTVLETWGTVGFDTGPVYRTYDEYANDAERAYLEYFLRDAYKFYGYDFHYYKGEEVDDDWVEEKALGAVRLDEQIADAYTNALCYKQEHGDSDKPKKSKEEIQTAVQDKLEEIQKGRVYIGKLLRRNIRLVNQEGEPLHMLPLLKLDPALLEQPLYH